MENTTAIPQQKDYFKRVRLLFFSFVVYCIIGWVYELFWYWIVEGTILNRGFLYGPYLPVYGFGCIFMVLFFTKLKDKKIMLGKLNIMPIILFFLVLLLSTAVELVTAYIADAAYGIRNPLWTYDQSFFNFDGKICLRASLIFGVCGTLCLYMVQPLIEKITDKIPEKAQNIIFYILSIGMIIDLCLSITFKLILK